MNRNWTLGAIAALAFALLPATGASGQDRAAPKSSESRPAADGGNPTADQPDEDAPLATVAVGRAAKANKYAFVFVYRAGDEATQKARQAFDAGMEKLKDRAVTVALDTGDPLEQGFVTKYGLDRAPLPLVLAIAPNGAVTRSFSGQFGADQFETAFVSPGTQKSLKALQDRKLAFICVQNDKTKRNAEAMQGVKDFLADPQYAKTTELITLDPADAAEEAFLKQLKVDPKTEEAVTVFMAPPGMIVGTYKGETKKDVLIAATKKAAKGCDPKSGCCPAPKKP